ncbi:hypothetical protein RRG08_017645 [Elysia crispata]|uniref:Uncharacterized protein n=1 Tax=Elysia crispata TaxID=231223 RepID=A0AAE0ZB45_9GAST|nr:hypothetical protein RRG08_017645 [Elysia crispata]
MAKVNIRYCHSNHEPFAYYAKISLVARVLTSPIHFRGAQGQYGADRVPPDSGDCTRQKVLRLLKYRRNPSEIILGISYSSEDTKMRKSLFAVCLSLALLVVYTTALSTMDSKEDIESMILKDSTWGIDEGLQVGADEILSTGKRTRTPYACRRDCHCRGWSKRACNYCLYLRRMCRINHGHETEA